MSSDPRMYPSGSGMTTDPWVGNVARFLRTRVTAAQLNASGGFILLPAIIGVKWQILDMSELAVGGAATSSTTIDLVATLAGATRKLLAVAIAALTQSALVRAGAANATILADGASFTANDANTAVVASVTGSAMTVATAIDYFLHYVPVLA